MLFFFIMDSDKSSIVDFPSYPGSIWSWKDRKFDVREVEKNAR